MAGILYLAVINQFLNQEHDIEQNFKSLIASNSSEVRRIPLPVNLSDKRVKGDLRKLHSLEDGEVRLNNISEMSEREVEQMMPGLMFCADSTISEHFRMLKIYLTKALDHSVETRKHRTFLVSMFEKA